MTKTEMAEFVMRFLEQLDKSEDENDTEETRIIDVCIVAAFEQALGRSDEDGDELARRGIILRSSTPYPHRTAGLLTRALAVNND